MASPIPGLEQIMELAVGEPTMAVRRIVDALPGGVCVVGLDGSVRVANRAACAILGLTFDELTRRYTVDFGLDTIREDGSRCPPEEYPVSRVLATGEPHPDVTIGVRRPDGKVSWAVFRAVDLRHPQSGELTGALVNFVDITDKKRAEDELAEKQQWLEQAHQIARMGSWTWNRSTGEVRWSDEMHAIYGTDRATFVPTWDKVLGFVHDSDRAAFQAASDRAWTAVGRQRHDFRVVHRDGGIRYVWGESQARPDGNDPHGQMVGILQDITDRVHHEEKRRELEEQLRHSQRMDSIGQLAGGVAHDFNNLIQVILGNTDLCLTPEMDEERRRESLGEIRRSAERAAELTRQMLAFSRRQEMRPANLDLNELLFGLVKMLRRLIGERIDLTFLPRSPLGAVFADASQIEQVILNLCVNARDAMPEGGNITISTRVEDVEAGRRVVIGVSDTGRGIPADAAARVFEPFFTTKAAGRGTGLGLSAVYGIVKQHGGTVDFRARPEGGTLFEVRLPQSGGAAARAPERPSDRAPGGTETVLVVEDEEMVRRLTIRVLEDAGYNVLSAANGREALVVFRSDARADDQHISLVLLDLVMPELGGDALYRELRDQSPNLKFLFTTGYPLNQDIDELVRRGVPALMKPYGADALLRKVREILSGPSAAS